MAFQSVNALLSKEYFDLAVYVCGWGCCGTSTALRLAWGFTAISHSTAPTYTKTRLLCLETWAHSEGIWPGVHVPLPQISSERLKPIAANCIKLKKSVCVCIHMHLCICNTSSTLTIL